MKPGADENIRSGLNPFLERFQEPRVIRRIAERAGIDVNDATEILAAYLAEATVGLDVAMRVCRSGRRILEVGAGSCLVSLYLRSRGFSVTALEPISAGFDIFSAVQEEIRPLVSDVDLPFLSIGAVDLDPDIHGTFDAIFSVNVVEHIPELDKALDAMVAVLRPGGLMVTMCPNYTFPYDPHFGVMTVPFAPKLSKRFVPWKARKTELWRDLSFPTHRDFIKLARRHDLAVKFEPELLYQAFSRLETDPEFRKRRGPAVRLTRTVLRRIGIIGLLKYVPPRLASPMIVHLRHRP